MIHTVDFLLGVEPGKWFKDGDQVFVRQSEYSGPFTWCRYTKQWWPMDMDLGFELIHNGILRHRVLRTNAT